VSNNFTLEKKQSQVFNLYLIPKMLLKFIRYILLLLFFGNLGFLSKKFQYFSKYNQDKQKKQKYYAIPVFAKCCCNLQKNLHSSLRSESKNNCRLENYIQLLN